MSANFILVICFISFFYLCVGDQYTTKFDNIDLDDIVKNERLLKNYMECLLDRGSCTPDGAELKRNLPDALQTDCSKCSPKQKEGSDYIVRFLIENKPDYWNQLEQKYDSDGIYMKKYLEVQHTTGSEVE